MTINGSPNQLYNNGLKAEDFWKETSRFFLKKKDKMTPLTRNIDAAKIQRTASGSGNLNCHIFLISDSQMNIQGRQLESV